MRRYRLYIGQHSDKGGHVFEYSNIVLDEAVQEALAAVGLAAHPRTSYRAQGQWGGVREPSTVVEFLTDDEIAGKLQQVATLIASALDQEAVLMTVENVEAQFVRATA